KQDRRGLETRDRDLSAEYKALGDSLKLREKKLAAAEKKLAELVGALTDAEERLERRERELDRLTSADGAAFRAAGSGGHEESVEQLLRERNELEARLHKVTEENLRLRVAGATES